MNKQNIYKLMAVAVAGMVVCSCHHEKQEVNYDVVPAPLHIENAQGEPFALKNGVKVFYPENDAKMQRNAEFLVEYVKDNTGIELMAEAGEGTTGIVLRNQPQADEPEGYQLQVSTDKVLLSGTPAGVFYGVQTLRKSIPADKARKVNLPAVNINDAPRFGYRGAMLDVCRHFFPVDSVKTYIDMCALHNINRLHLHLTEDQGWRIEIKSRPLLTEKGSMRKETVIGHNTGRFDGKPHGGFYTQEQARELVAYAAERNITIIPEIDLPGHMMAALHAYPELGCTGGPYEVLCQWGVADEVLCAGNDATLEFLDDVLGEIVDIFPSEYIHVGGDECPKVRWEKCPKCQKRIKELGLKSDEHHTAEQYLQSYIMRHVADFLASKGRRLIGWDEILEGGLADNATVMSWRGEKGGIAAAQQKHDVVMTPNTYVYFDYYQSDDVANEPEAIGGYLPVETVYSYEPMPKALTAEEQKHIIGVQANVWTEYMPTFHQVQYMALPRMAALAEVQWSAPEKKDYDAFLGRLQRLLPLYDLNNYYYAKHIYNIDYTMNSDAKTQSVTIDMKTIDNTPIYYTTDGTVPTKRSKRYEAPLKLTEACTFQAVAISKQHTSSLVKEEIALHKASFKPIKLLNETHQNYTFSGAPLLLDAMRGNRNYQTGRWIGIVGKDLDAVIDLEQPTTISSVSVPTLVVKGDWIFDLTRLAVSISKDGEKFTEIASNEYPILRSEDPDKVYDHTINFAPVETRYLKVTATPVQALPDWHKGKGYAAFIFVDEIMVN